jgi:hypothetical protein
MIDSIGYVPLVIYSVLNGATDYVLKVKYSVFVAGFMENMDLVLPLAQ